MNNMPNVKIGKLRDSLRSIDRQLADSKKQKNNTEIRVLIDKRRHALAQLEDEIAVDPLFAHRPDDDIYTTNPQTQQFIEAWCARVKQAAPDIVSFKNDEFCNLFIDHVLPQKWNFDNDTIVVISPPSEFIIKALKNRG